MMNATPGFIGIERAAAGVPNGYYRGFRGCPAIGIGHRQGQGISTGLGIAVLRTRSSQ